MTIQLGLSFLVVIMGKRNIVCAIVIMNGLALQ